jgi:flagellar motility protein MotE (MotC chaperone)
MNYLAEKLRNKNFLRNLFLAKLVVLGVIGIALNGGWHIGDKQLSASEVAAQEAAAQEAGTKEAEKKTVDNSASEKGETSTGKKNESNAPNDKKPRRSFLANLLNLPELDPDGLKKEEVSQYLEIAERKKRQIEDRLDILQKREDQLMGLETSIDDKLKHLDEERRFLAQTLQKEKDLKGERLDKIILLYAKMEPKKAAPVIEKLDKDLVVELFKQISQKQVTAILETMNPDKAVELSEYFGRVRSAREYDLLKEMNQSLRKEFEDCRGMP